jgi:hypothetical protein
MLAKNKNIYKKLKMALDKVLPLKPVFLFNFYGW